MYTVRRITTAPNSPIKILVDQPSGDGDPGLSAGGMFYFYPAGSEDGDSAYTMSEFAARAIMDDPGLAMHFACQPPLPARRPVRAPESLAEPEPADA